MKGVWLVLAVACTTPPRAVTTIPGVQVVAIKATPPQPAPLDTLTLDTWVADGIGRGTDVLLWVCTPVDGLCVEGSPPGLNGIPFEFWTEVSRADPRSTTTNRWPLYGGIAAGSADLPEGFEGGGLFVWALACVPGFCPIMEEIAIDSAPGSEPWLRVAEGLADPARWVEAAPEGTASLAVKLIPMWDEDATTEGDDIEESLGRNLAPTLTEKTPVPRGTWPPAVVTLDIAEPDGDVLQRRSFATSGLIRDACLDDATGTVETCNEIRVDWASRANDGGRPPQLFLAVEDERGATDVWSSDKGRGPDPCEAPVEVVYTTPAYPGAGLSAGMGGNPTLTTFTVTGTVPGAEDTSVAIGFEMRVAETGEILATAPQSGPQEFDAETCTAAFDRDIERVGPPNSLCTYGGALVEIEATVTDDGFVVATETTQAVLELDPDLPCAR